MRDEPLNQAHEQALIKRYANVASTQLENGDLSDAATSIERALDLGARVVAREPGNKENAVSQLRALTVASGIEHARAFPIGLLRVVGRRLRFTRRCRTTCARALMVGRR